jgi:hypothetical protein
MGLSYREMLQQYIAALETRPQKEILAVTLSSIGDAVIITDIKGRITFLKCGGGEAHRLDRKRS